MRATLKASLAATMAAALVWGATVSVAVDPEQAKQFVAAAQSAEADGDYAVALREYRRLLEVYPNEPGLQAPVYLAMSQAAYKTGDGEQGREFAVISHSLDPALDGRVAEDETAGVKTRGGPPTDKAATAIAIMQAALSTIAALHPPRVPVQQPAPPVYPGTPYGQGGYQPPPGNMTAMPGYPDPNAAPSGYPPQGAPGGYQLQQNGQPGYPPQGPPTDFGPPVSGQPGYPPQGGYQPPQTGQPTYPPQGAPGGYQPPQTGQPTYPPQGAPGGYQPPQTGQPSYPPQGAPGGYQPPQTGQPTYPPQGAPGGYQPPQTGQPSYPPQGAPGGYQPPQTGQPTYPPQGATGGYQPPQTGQAGYPPQGAPGGYQPPQTGQAGYPPQGAPGQPPQTGQPGYPPQGRQAGMPPQNTQGRNGQPTQGAPGRYYPAPPADQYRPQANVARRAMRGENAAPIRVLHDHSRLGDQNYFENSCGALLTVDGGELTFTPGGTEGPRVIPASEIVEIRLNAAVGKEIGAFHIITKKGLYLHLAVASGSRDEARTVVDGLRQQLGLEQ